MPEYSDQQYDEFASAISQAFPAEAWDEPRLEALKEAIRVCVEADAGGPDALLIAGPKKPPAKGRQKAEGLAALIE